MKKYYDASDGSFSGGIKEDDLYTAFDKWGEVRPQEQQKEESQDELWTNVITNICEEFLRSEHFFKLEHWSKSISKELKTQFTITRR